MFTDRNRRHRGRCTHPERIRTTNFGLERSVCADCGDMEMRNLPGEPGIRGRPADEPRIGSGRLVDTPRLR